MIKQLKKYNRSGETFFLGLMSIVCFCLSVFRFIYTDTKVFLFLNWNLFLAFIPWLLSSTLILYHGLQKSKVGLTLLVFAWLLFFPNAPYILTDLFHLQMQSTMPIWFDLLLILSFAWVGLLFGFMSLWDIEKILSTRINKKIIPIISAVLLFLGSFGIYIGRYLRWNSWDIISEPFALLYDIGNNIINPFQHLRTWGMTFLMFLFLYMIYWSFRFVKNRVE